MVSVIYAGSFDPPTIGHTWMIDQAMAIFNEVIVAVGHNPSKKNMFSLDERIQMLQEISNDKRGFTVDSFQDDFLVKYAKQQNVHFVLRGLRSQDDFNHEIGVKQINERIEPTVQTVFLSPPREYSDISSSVVKGMTGFNGWENIVSEYVSPQVLEKLKEKINY